MISGGNSLASIDQDHKWMAFTPRSSGGESGFQRPAVVPCRCNERSFTKAAAKLGIAQSTLSHTIKRLEERMGLRLLMRTTRNVAPTEAGERLRQSLAPRIAEIEADIAALMTFRDKPSGTVRITLSDHALEGIVWPKLRPILLDYPDIKVELSRDNGLRNIVEDGFDAGGRLGQSVEKDGGLYAWEFGREGQELRVRVDWQLTFNTSFAQVEAAVAGYGIAFQRQDAGAAAISPRGRASPIACPDWRVRSECTQGCSAPRSIAALLS
jgi:DNA-binding transcriptional LysR family regulator